MRYDGEKLNLRLVDFVNEAVNEKVYDNEPMYQEFAPIYNEYGAIVTEKNYNSYRKVYAGDAANGILDNVDLYDRTENDLFVVEETEKPMYRRVVSPLDTVSIFRDGNNQSVLFESKGFLGMENLSQFPNIAPGMIADTALSSTVLPLGVRIMVMAQLASTLSTSRATWKVASWLT